MKVQKAFWGLVRYREVPIPTLRGVFLFSILSVALLSILVLTAHQFFAVSHPVRTGVLVVEGWVPEYVLRVARDEFMQHRYEKLYVTGGPTDSEEDMREYGTYAVLGATKLMRMGMSKDVVQAVPSPSVRRDRTYASALALRASLYQDGAIHKGVDVVSIGVHARRSRLLFQRAFGESPQVGIIAVEDRSYDPTCWWNSSQGVRTLVGEFVAYMYAILVFPFFGLA